MSGFLHRLAARTLGLAPQVRPRAALSYAAPQSDFPGAEAPGEQAAAISDADAARAPPQGGSRGNPRHQEPWPAELLARPAATESAVTPRPAGRTADSVGSGFPRAVAPVPYTHPTRLAENAAFPPSQPDPGAGPEHARLLPETPSQDAATTIPDAAKNRFGDLETLVSQLLGQGKDNQQPTPPRHAPDLVPVSITAPTDVSPIRTQASRTRPVSPALAAASDAAPEVHITIGRLEVNPPSRPAPPPAPGPRGQAALSLSDYLARRNGGRS